MVAGCRPQLREPRGAEGSSCSQPETPWCGSPMCSPCGPSPRPSADGSGCPRGFRGENPPVRERASPASRCRPADTAGALPPGHVAAAASGRAALGPLPGPSLLAPRNTTRHKYFPTLQRKQGGERGRREEASGTRGRARATGRDSARRRAARDGGRTGGVGTPVMAPDSLAGRCGAALGKSSPRTFGDTSVLACPPSISIPTPSPVGPADAAGDPCGTCTRQTPPQTGCQPSMVPCVTPPWGSWGWGPPPPAPRS